MPEWNQITIGDVAEVKGGKRLPKGMSLVSENNGSPYVRITDWYDGSIDTRNVMYVPEDALKIIDRYRIFSGDIFISIAGTIGRVALIGNELDGAFLTENAARISVRDQNMNPSFLRYILISTIGQEEVLKRTVGSTQPKLALHRIKDITIPYPPRSVQDSIAEVLGALDDKIAANTKLAQASLELSRAKFKQLINQTANKASLKDVLSLEYGKSLPAPKRHKGDVDVFGSGGIVGTHNEALFPGPGVIVGRKGTAGTVHWAPRAYFPIDTTYYVVPRKPSTSLIFCMHLLETLGLNEMNSDSAVPGLNREEAYSTQVRVPEESDIQRFTDSSIGLFEGIDQANAESRALACMRDLLLPQLMSGKLKVKQAEEIVASVV